MRYGGNTSCVVLESADADPLILDLGTGLRYFGEDYCLRSGAPFKGTALLSHLHWDHVQGLPFFPPINKEGAHLDIVGIAEGDGGIAASFGKIMTPPYFPVCVKDLAGHVSFFDLDGSTMAVGDATVTARRVPHVGVTNGYRVEWRDASVAYISDHQQPLEDASHVAAEVIELGGGVDVLIHDAQYTDDEFSSRRHWGHCTIDYAFEVARRCEPRVLVLFHHDPLHHDDVLDRLQSELPTLTRRYGLRQAVVAYEGLSLEVAGGTVHVLGEGPVPRGGGRDR